MPKMREVVFQVETAMGDDPLEVRFQSSKYGGTLWAEVHDRVADMLKEAQAGDSVWRIELIQSHDQHRSRQRSTWRFRQRCRWSPLQARIR